MQSSDVWLYPKPWVSDTTTCVWLDGKDTRVVVRVYTAIIKRLSLTCVRLRVRGVHLAIICILKSVKPTGGLCTSFDIQGNPVTMRLSGPPTLPRYNRYLVNKHIIKYIKSHAWDYSLASYLSTCYDVTFIFSLLLCDNI